VYAAGWSTRGMGIGIGTGSDGGGRRKEASGLNLGLTTGLGICMAEMGAIGMGAIEAGMSRRTTYT
jgi:hypothetical protein